MRARRGRKAVILKRQLGCLFSELRCNHGAGSKYTATLSHGFPSFPSVFRLKLKPECFHFSPTFSHKFVLKFAGFGFRAFYAVLDPRPANNAENS